MTNSTENKTQKKEMKWRGTKSLATLVGLGIAAASFLPTRFYENMRGAYDHAVYGAQTVEEMAVGTKGERALSGLQKSIEDVRAAAGANEDARKTLESYASSVQGSVEGLDKIYKDNETFAREAERFSINMQGLYKSVSDMANDLKPQFMDKVDDVILKLYGTSRAEAVEKSEAVRSLYGSIRKFYDARASNEGNLAAMLDHLKGEVDERKALNEKIAPILEQSRKTLDLTYRTEDEVFAAHRKRDKADLGALDKNIAGYKDSVAETQASISAVTPVPSRGYGLGDFLCSPLGLGLVAGVVAKVGIRGSLPSFVNNKVSYGLALPVHAVTVLGNKSASGVVRATKHVGPKIANGARTMINNINEGPRFR